MLQNVWHLGKKKDFLIVLLSDSTFGVKPNILLILQRDVWYLSTRRISISTFATWTLINRLFICYNSLPRVISRNNYYATP